MIQHTLIPQVLWKLDAIRMSDGSSLASSLIQLFLEATPLLLDELEDAIGADDTPTTARIIARLRGSSSSLGAIRFSALCGDFELSPPTTPAALAKRMERLRDEYACLSDELRHYIAPTYVVKYGT